MKGSLVSAAVAAFVLATSFLTTESTAQPTPKPQLDHPNIVPIAVKLKATYPCTAGSLGIFTYSVTVKNEGSVAYISTPGPYGEGAAGLVWADDEHNGGWPSGRFADELTSTPTLAPNATATVDIEVPYWTQDPAHMTAYPTHTFRTRSLGYWVPLKGMKDPAVPHNSGPTFVLPAPKGCPKTRR